MEENVEMGDLTVNNFSYDDEGHNKGKNENMLD